MKSDWPSENIVLGLLAERPMHGYELSSLIRDDEALRAIWRMERSEVYFLLGKLVKGGHIEEVRSEPGGGPARVVYAPTEAGLNVLSRWLGSPEQYPRNLRTALLARVYIALRRDPNLALNLIDEQARVLENWLVTAGNRSEANEVVAAVHRLRMAQVQAVLGALDDLRSLAKARLGMAASLHQE
jgi:DNA-binding PadR family transcriptional regulator